MALPQNTALSFSNLETLLDLAEAGSITATAERKRRDAATVSRHLRDLELYFGCKLKKRTGKTVSLSPEGEELAAMIRAQFKALEGFRDKRTANLNSVSIAAGDSLVHLVLLPGLAAIQQTDRFKNTTFDVADMGTLELMQAIQNYSVDIGLLRKDSILKRGLREKGLGTTKMQAGSFGQRELGEYKYSVFVPRKLWAKREVEENEIFKLPFASIKKHWGTDFVHEAQQVSRLSINVRVWCVNFTQVFRLVRLECYAGILPIFCKEVLRPEKFLTFEPAFLAKNKHKIVMAWNPGLMEVRGETLMPFIEALVLELKRGACAATGGPARSA